MPNFGRKTGLATHSNHFIKQPRGANPVEEVRKARWPAFAVESCVPWLRDGSQEGSLRDSRYKSSLLQNRAAVPVATAAKNRDRAYPRQKPPTEYQDSCGSVAPRRPETAVDKLAPARARSAPLLER